MQTERSEVCTGDRGQFSHTDRPNSVNKMFIIWPNRKSKDKKYICSPARAQAFSWLTSVTSLQSKRGKNNCSKYSFVQTSSMNEDKITVVFLQAQ